MIRDTFKCPCGYPQYCGCKACVENFTVPEGIRRYTFIKGTENVQCQGCKVIRHGCEWMDIEYEYYERKKKDADLHLRK